jgi:2-polyprenyl-6-methoxyphenol hydroxylase-like FAD-dependent oxidoreductase
MALQDSIRVVSGDQKNAFTRYPVIIVGAGASGIAMGCCLKKRYAFDQFRIFDRQSGIGGMRYCPKITVAAMLSRSCQVLGGSTVTQAL